MENPERELVSVKGERLERFRAMISSFEKQKVERKTFRELAEDIRWLIRQKFENEEQLMSTYDDIRKRHFAILGGMRNKLQLSIQKSQSIRENTST